MCDAPTCFISFNLTKTYGPFTVHEALKMVDAFLQQDNVSSAPESVRVWNLGWRRSRPIDAARPYLVADLRKAKYSVRQG